MGPGAFAFRLAMPFFDGWRREKFYWPTKSSPLTINAFKASQRGDKHMAANIRRTLSTAIGLAAAILLAPKMALAQNADFPAQPIRIVVPYGAGGIGDITARALSQYLDGVFDQPVVVENRPGASGLIAMNSVKNAKPDGYTLVMTSNTTVSAAKHIFKNLVYDPMRDFSHIGMVGSYNSLALVSPGAPFKTIEQLVEYSKENPSQMFFGYTNTSSQVPAEMLNKEAGIEMTGVAYKDPSQAFTDLASGQIQFMFMDTAAATGFLKSGKLLPIAVTSPARMSDRPDLPAMSELYPGFEFTGYITVSAPAGTPQAIVEKLNAAIVNAAHDSRFLTVLNTTGITPQTFSAPELLDFINKENERWEKYAAVAKLTPQ
ncbi:tripartite tricarboxylate transporter substrate binding protein [Pusillimonas sp. SM2304]|uniref:Bug family tripartite tricarboxylate transporter substrate binding protein n=1 Tax=Pusillimonas sp. SM2304 TaxID=3073241 RepID=UPI0028759509|nr:tripartite tricarboxylate transporter substrate binding protein [Pusillimonas sp. SM2304]MDS1140446.1 tripartite tricarboxylate transporter substrate binding protein [Pusillimonas sp. SM2304]